MAITSIMGTWSCSNAFAHPNAPTSCLRPLLEQVRFCALVQSLAIVPSRGSLPVAEGCASKETPFDRNRATERRGRATISRSLDRRPRLEPGRKAACLSAGRGRRRPS
jgi:hypothetical protein